MIICRFIYFWSKCQSYESFYRFYQNFQINSPLIWNVWNLFLCIGRDRSLTESIHSHIIGVTFGFAFLLFRFCHDYTDCLPKLLIWQWCIVIIILISYSFQQLCIVFVFWGVHARSFICHIKSVQNIPTTIEYVKISEHFMCNWRFLILCLNICFFLFVYTFVNAFWFIFLCRKFVNNDDFWLFLVHGTDMR